MAQPIRQMEVCIDARTGARISDADHTLALPALYYRDQFELTVRLLRSDDAGNRQPVQLPEGMHYTALASYGSDPAQPLLLCADTAQSIDRLNGTIVFYIDTFTQRFYDVVHNDDRYLRISGRKLAELAILAIDPNHLTEQVVGKFDFEPVGRPDDASPAPTGGENTITVATGSMYNFFWAR